MKLILYSLRANILKTYSYVLKCLMISNKTLVNAPAVAAVPGDADEL